jgi:class 3 adenylate cyclase/tetratricopeptide (TPR) repeat protein
MTLCPNCGNENSDQARFCQHCGTALPQPEAPTREVRKTVTVLFADVTGSTSLGEQLDPESLRDVMGRYFDGAKVVIERHGGTVEKFIGDAVMAVFGIPKLHEDDALRAVRAAVDLNAALASLNEELRAQRGVAIATRTGVNTGEVVAGDPASGQRLVTGDAVNVAARLEQAASPGEILISEPTYRLVKDAVHVEPVAPLVLKGKAEPVPAYVLRDVIAEAAPYARRLDSPMVGRTRELQLLRQAFERASTDRACQLFTVLGAAGVGKSRLTEEFVTTLPPHARLLRGRCLPYGEGITYWPVAEVVREAAGIDETDSPVAARQRIGALLSEQRDANLIEERLTQMIGLEEARAMPEETFWAFRKLLESLAKTTPLVVHVDDIHWAEPTLLDLIEHVADWTRDAPLLLLTTARPELLDKRPTWGGGKLNATTVLLEALTDEETDHLVENILGTAALAGEDRQRITDATEGNPLFVEQLVAMLIDDGHLQARNGHWVPTTDLSTVKMPSTIQALLAARLDQLEEQERTAAERASIEGKVFHAGGVVELAPEAQKAQMRASLMGLVRKELIRPDDAELPGEDAFRFRHLLIRDAAYQAMPKQTRAELHEKFADWLARVADVRIAEYDEILGYHLEQAYRLRAELGPPTERSAALGRRSAERLTAAGRRAKDRGDIPAAINLLQRAVDLLPQADPERLRALSDLCEALVEGAELDRLDRALDEGLRIATEVGDERRGAYFRLGRLQLGFHRPDEPVEHLREEGARFLEIFERHGDLGGLARVHRIFAFGHWLQCEFGAVRDEAGRALELARQTGDDRLEAEMIDIMSAANLWGPAPVAQAMAEAEDYIALARSRGGRRLEVAATSGWARLLMMAGREQEARDALIRRRTATEDLGMRLEAIGSYDAEGMIELTAGNLEEAERALRRAFELFEAVGEKGFNSTTAARLSVTLSLQDRMDEAIEFSRVSEQLASPDDVVSQSMWRSGRAMALAASGEPEEGERLAREAVELADRTDSHVMRGDARAHLGEVLERAGNREAGRDALVEALAIYEAKGAISYAANVRRRLELLAGNG